MVTWCHIGVSKASSKNNPAARHAGLFLLVHGGAASLHAHCQRSVNPTGQWSLPNTSLCMVAAATLLASRCDTRK